MSTLRIKLNTLIILKEIDIKGRGQDLEDQMYYHIVLLRSHSK